MARSSLLAPVAPLAPQQRPPAGAPPRRTAAPAQPRRPIVAEPLVRRDRAVTVARPPQPVRPVAHPPQRPEVAWPASFDDWMIDIVRRRALRLNSGARRRGARGAVRAAELAQILDRSKDANGRWRCALCQEPVTLTDLSFDHVVALADGGEHAAYNLVPAHRKCNEIKGSEKAQSRVQALDRWLAEWAVSHNGATPRGAARHHTTQPTGQPDERRYA